MTEHNIYLDYAAATPMHPEVLESMLPYFSKKFGNASSQHKYGREARQALDKARLTVAKILNCKSKEIIFTSSGTASNNLAIIGCARANKKKGKHIISSQIEHSSIYEPLKFLEKQENFELDLLGCNQEGIIDIDTFQKTIKNNTIFTSIIWGNNEIGVIQDIHEFAKVAREKKIIFHTDACQIFNSIKVDLELLPIDLLTLNGSKIYGPKGVGALFIREGTDINPVILGGTHEYGLWSGTENIASIVGFAKAMEIAEKNREKETKTILHLRNKLINGILNEIKGAKLNGSRSQRLDNNINFYFPDLNANEFLIHLDNQGIYCSSGAACNVGKPNPSRILLAIGLEEKETFKCLRLSLGSNTTEQNIDYVIQQICEIHKQRKTA